VLNPLALALVKTPLTMMMLYALERFGPRAAAGTVVVSCALLAMATVELALTLLQSIGSILSKARSHVRRGRWLRLMPLVAFAVCAALLVSSSTPPALHSSRTRTKLHGSGRIGPQPPPHNSTELSASETDAQAASVDWRAMSLRQPGGLHRNDNSPAQRKTRQRHGSRRSRKLPLARNRTRSHADI
jgi:hypothetical protein